MLSADQVCVRARFCDTNLYNDTGMILQGEGDL